MNLKRLSRPAAQSRDETRSALFLGDPLLAPFALAAVEAPDMAAPRPRLPRREIPGAAETENDQQDEQISDGVAVIHHGLMFDGAISSAAAHNRTRMDRRGAAPSFITLRQSTTMSPVMPKVVWKVWLHLSG
jgi:hypothetical protein